VKKRSIVGSKDEYADGKGIMAGRLKHEIENNIRKKVLKKRLSLLGACGANRKVVPTAAGSPTRIRMGERNNANML
jgi:hypothetical protein